jgi:phosphoribosylanthranilate isomerase
VAQPPSCYVKICGLSTVAHLRVAESCGAAYVGFIVEVARSPRSLSRWQARVLARAARVPSVVVTTSEDPDEVAELARIVQPTAVQLHGEGSALLSRLRDALPDAELWQVVAVEVDHLSDLKAAARIEAAVGAGAARIVLDSARGGRSGGTGLAMDWDAAAELVEAAGTTPAILAGGLNPGNVGEAIRRVRPAGVDVSSGVETAPNVKSPALIRAFCEAVRQVTPA